MKYLAIAFGRCWYFLLEEAYIYMPSKKKKEESRVDGIDPSKENSPGENSPNHAQQTLAQQLADAQQKLATVKNNIARVQEQKKNIEEQIDSVNKRRQADSLEKTKTSSSVVESQKVKHVVQPTPRKMFCKVDGLTFTVLLLFAVQTILLVRHFLFDLGDGNEGLKYRDYQESRI